MAATILKSWRASRPDSNLEAVVPDPARGCYRVGDGRAERDVSFGRLGDLRAGDRAYAVADSAEFLRAAAVGGDTEAVWSLARDGRVVDRSALLRLVNAASGRGPAALEGGRDLGPAGLHAECDELLQLAADADREAPPRGRAAGPAGSGRGFGSLGIELEVMAALAVAAGRPRVRYGPGVASALRACRDRELANAAALRPLAAAHVFETKNGRIVLDGRGIPKTDPEQRAEWLNSEASKARRNGGVRVPVALARISSGEESVDAARHRWERAAESSEPVYTWLRLTALCELAAHAKRHEDGSEFEVELDAWPRLQPRRRAYDLLLPGDAPRPLFAPASGGYLLRVSFPHLEWRCLGQCLAASGAALSPRPPVEEVARRIAGMTKSQFVDAWLRSPAEIGRYMTLATLAIKELPRGIRQQDLSWRFGLVAQAPTTITEVRLAAEAVAELVPALAEYLDDDSAGRAAGAMGVTREEFLSAVGGLAGAETEPGELIADALLGGGDGGLRTAFLAAIQDLWRGSEPSAAHGDLYERLVGRAHRHPTGRVVGGATPWDTVGTDHLALADAARACAAFAAASAGYQVAAVDGGDLVLSGLGNRPRDAAAREVEAAIRPVLSGRLGAIAEFAVAPEIDLVSRALT